MPRISNVIDGPWKKARKVRHPEDIVLVVIGILLGVAALALVFG